MPLTVDVLSIMFGLAGSIFGLYMMIKNNRKSDTKDATDGAVKLANIEANLANLVVSVDGVKTEVERQRDADQKFREDIVTVDRKIDNVSSAIDLLKMEFKRYQDSEKQFNAVITELKGDLKILSNKVEKAFDVIDELRERVSQKE